MTWAAVSRDDLTWPLGQPKIYPSSDFAERGFCGECGTALTFRFLKDNNEIDIAAVCFDDPGIVKPLDHIWTKTRPKWVKLGDGLPEHREKRDG